MEQPLISICIPAYKNEEYLIRLLDSIKKQNFNSYEVVICDDSPNDALRLVVDKYKMNLSITYFRNLTPLGSPANWNKSIELARGKWIKIMHDDDWFAYNDSLQKFANYTQNTNSDFIFCGFFNVDLSHDKKTKHLISKLNLSRLIKNPLYLFRTNYIGHPSTTLIRNSNVEWFDEKLKWVVDFEFYIRQLKSNKNIISIPEALINIGISNAQITKSVFRNPIVEIPENLYILNKIGLDSFRYIYLYDYYWRLLRNLGLRSEIELRKYLPQAQTIPSVIIDMISIQKLVPSGILKIRPVSKIIMTFGWLCFMTKRNK
jgi:glycosyltransferase involved in cell wall biosynthesis